MKTEVSSPKTEAGSPASSSLRGKRRQLQHDYWTDVQLNACVTAWLQRNETRAQRIQLRWLRSEAFDRWVSRVGQHETEIVSTYLNGGDFPGIARGYGVGRTEALHIVERFFGAASWWLLRADLETHCSLSHHEAGGNADFQSRPLDWAMSPETVAASINTQRGETGQVIHLGRRLRQVTVDTWRAGGRPGTCGTCELIRQVTWDGWVEVAD